MTEINTVIEDNIKIVPSRVTRDDMDWMNLAKYRNKKQAFGNTAMTYVVHTILGNS
jgi:hypothetical protein